MLSKPIIYCKYNCKLSLIIVFILFYAIKKHIQSLNNFYGVVSQGILWPCRIIQIQSNLWKFLVQPSSQHVQLLGQIETTQSLKAACAWLFLWGKGRNKKKKKSLSLRLAWPCLVQSFDVFCLLSWHSVEPVAFSSITSLKFKVSDACVANKHFSILHIITTFLRC